MFISNISATKQIIILPIMNIECMLHSLLQPKQLLHHLFANGFQCVVID